MTARMNTYFKWGFILAVFLVLDFEVGTQILQLHLSGQNARGPEYDMKLLFLIQWSPDRS